jgi:hypothetical protein
MSELLRKELLRSGDLAMLFSASFCHACFFSEMLIVLS